MQEDRVEGAMHRRQRVLVANERRVNACGDAVFGVIDHGEQLHHLAFRGGGGNVVGGDVRDAFHGHVVDADVRVEAERGHDRRLVRGIVAFDVTGRVGLGIALLLGLLECDVEIEALGGHLVENVVRRAVDNAEHALHLISDERLAQRAHDRDRAADRRLEVDIRMVVFGRLIQFRAVLREQRLVRGDHRRAVVERLQHEGARDAGAADELDHNVRVLHHRHRVAGEQRLVDPREVHLVRVQAGDAGDFEGTANALPELVLLLDQDARRLRANGAGSK